MPVVKMAGCGTFVAANLLSTPPLTQKGVVGDPCGLIFECMVGDPCECAPELACGPQNTCQSVQPGFLAYARIVSPRGFNWIEHVGGGNGKIDTTVVRVVDLPGGATCEMGFPSSGNAWSWPHVYVGNCKWRDGTKPVASAMQFGLQMRGCAVLCRRARFFGLCEAADAEQTLSSTAVGSDSAMFAPSTLVAKCKLWAGPIAQCAAGTPGCVEITSSVLAQTAAAAFSKLCLCSPFNGRCSCNGAGLCAQNSGPTCSVDERALPTRHWLFEKTGGSSGWDKGSVGTPLDNGMMRQATLVPQWDTLADYEEKPAYVPKRLQRVHGVN